MENITECKIKDNILVILFGNYYPMDWYIFEQKLLEHIPSESLHGNTLERLLDVMKLQGHIVFETSPSGTKYRITEQGIKFYDNGKGSYCMSQQVIEQTIDQSLHFHDKVEKTNVAHHSPNAQQKLEFVEQKGKPKNPKDKEIFGIPVKKLKIIIATIILTGLLTAAGKKVMTYFPDPTKERSRKDSSKTNESIKKTTKKELFFR